MGVPTQNTHLYNTGLGLSSVKPTKTTNAMGETVVGYQNFNPNYYKSVLQGAANLGLLGSSSSSGSGDSAMDKGAAAGNAAIANAQTGVPTAKNAQSSVQAKITNANADLEEAKAAARGMSDDINGIRSTADALNPYAQLLASMGQSLYQQGNETSEVGKAIRAGDSSMGGILGQFIDNAQNAFSPDAYVSQAATDTQASYDNMLGQLMRSLSRSGASTSGGNAMQAKSDWAKTAAAAIAGAKTRSRLQGLKDQQTQLSNALQTALSYDQQATTQKQQGMAGVESAAGIVEKKGSLLATASAQGAAQSSAFANIAGVEVDLGEIEVSAAKNVQDAINNVTSAQEALMNFYGNFATEKETSHVNWLTGDITKTTTKS